ncbi:hypothetical protein FS749_004009 [Ceratobasidium sp. UAMH 11750]|nr:hypothetical protein FS749_004009 [Ceratobasidium sp. UAMH 11750]
MAVSGNARAVHGPKTVVKPGNRLFGTEEIGTVFTVPVLKFCLVAGIIAAVILDLVSVARSGSTWVAPSGIMASLEWARLLKALPYKMRVLSLNIVWWTVAIWVVLFSFFIYSSHLNFAQDARRPCADRKALIVSRNMAIAEIIDIVCAHGCPNVTKRLHKDSINQTPTFSGGFGDIYEGRMDSGRKRVAIKCSRATLASTDDTHKALKDLSRELYVWSKLRHPNVADLYGLVQFRDRVGVVSPWMENGNIMQYIKTRPATNRYSLCAQIARGLDYLHATRVVHGDLKGANVLIADDGTVKITDFGNAVLRDASLRFTATTGALDCSVRWAVSVGRDHLSPVECSC